MGWFGKLTFGTMGLLFGGPLGAIAGAALGHHLVDRRDHYSGEALPLGQAEQSQAAYFVSMFSILGKLAKVDGAVTRSEIAVVEDFLRHLNIPEQQKQFAKQIFREAKGSPYSIDDFAAQLYQINQHQPTILMSFMDLLFKLVSADGTMHPSEETSLNRIKEIFRISDRQFDSIRANYFKDVDKVCQRLSKMPVEFQLENPVTALMSDVKAGKLRKDILDEKVLSCILEFKADMAKMPDILNVIEAEARQLDTVVALGVAVRCDSNGNDTVRHQLEEMGYDVWRAKINMGLGRHTNPVSAGKETLL